MKPPPTWILLYVAPDSPSYNREKNENHHHAFEHVAKPRTPALHREPILAADAVLISVKRKLQQSGQNQQQCDNNGRLNEAEADRAFSPVAKLRCDSQIQDAEKNQQTPNRIDDPQLAAEIVERRGLGQLVRRQSVFGSGSQRA